MESSFERLGEPVPASPVVLSVPHAGRDYPPALRAMLRVPAAALVALEDRHVDAVALRAWTTETLFLQGRARAWIDLNRGEDERDPRVDAGAAAIAPTPTTQPVQSSKLRSGLGLVPRRVPGASDLWRGRFTDADIVARIRSDHRPYHAALAGALAAARARFGVAVLLDIHSMPPLGPPRSVPRIVLGDRFGAASAPRFVARLEAEAAGAGIACALNSPYAGGHILATHGRPFAGVHAIQLELDRSLYLDHRLDRPGVGLAATGALVARMIAALADEALASFSLAAE